LGDIKSAKASSLASNKQMDFNRYPIGSLKPAPFIEKAVPHDIPTLEALLKDNPKDIPTIHALGNLFFHKGDLDSSSKKYDQLIKLENKNAAAHFNLGILRLNQQEAKSAMSSFKKAAKLEPKDLDTLYHLALSAARIGKLEVAKKQLLEIIEQETSPTLVHGLLAGVCEVMGDQTEAKKYYGMAFSQFPNEEVPDDQVSDKLLELELKEFEKYMNSANYLRASNELSELSQKFGNALGANRVINQAINSLSKRIKDDGELDELISDYRKTKSPEAAYSMFTTLYLSLGLIPEFYIEADKAKTEIERWEEALEDRGDHPYAHFMIAICFSYLGDLESSLERILICTDKLLPKKQVSLRLKSIEQFLKFIIYNQDEQEITLSDASLSSWKQAGFGGDFEIRLWREQGFSPKEAKSWHQAGVASRLAAESKKLQLDPTVVADYVKVGINKAKSIRNWSKAEIEPDLAKTWSEELPDKESVAIQFIKLGISKPKEAKKWLSIFSMPWDAAAWHQFGYTPEEATEQIRKGINQPKAKDS